MKTINKLKAIGLSLALLGTTLAGCKKESVANLSGTNTSQNYKSIPPNRSGLTIRLINTASAPAYKKVNVEIRRIDVLYEKSDPIGWLTLTETPKMYDLLHLQNATLVENAKVSDGRIIKLRLFLGSHNSLVTLNDNNRAWFQLVIPSSYNSGVEVSVNSLIKHNESSVITLNFDANASISNEGNGEYILYPDIKSKRIYDPLDPPTPFDAK